MSRPPLARALGMEFLGTALLVLLGDGAVAAVVLLGKQPDWALIAAGWGLAVAVALSVTGGHLNPAVTLALATRGDFPVSRVLPYWAAQVLGAMAGAGLLYLHYAVAFTEFELDRGITRGVMDRGRLSGSAAGGAGVFCTFPTHGDLPTNLFSEALGTAVLLLGTRGSIYRRGRARRRPSDPLMAGMVVAAISLSLGGLTGAAINPARDFGPRLVAMLCGWGRSVFASHDSYFWVPIVGPLVGGIVGAWAYDSLIAVPRRLPVNLE